MESAAVTTLKSLSVTTVRSVRQVVASLSGGQRQAVAVAKAVMWNSKLVIMDEPTAALGVAQTAMVLALTRRLAERGLGVIFVSHNFNDVFEVADQIAVLYLGRLVASIPAAHLDRQMVVDLVTTGTTTRDVPGQTLSERSLTMAQETGLNPPAAGDVVAQVPPGEEGSPTGQQGSVVSFGAYLRTYLARVRSGDSGVLPVVGGLLAISIIFQIGNSHFLTAENLVNLLQQGSIYMVMAMGIVFVLLLGEIDLPVGYVGLVGGAIAAEMLSANHPLALVVVTALAATAAIGFLQGLLITRLGLPSFVVTLAGLLGWEGVLLLILGNGGTVPINDNYFDDFASGYFKNLAMSWVIVGALVLVFSFVLWRRDNRRRSSGLVAPPISLTVLKIVAIAFGGLLLVLLVNSNRGPLPIAPIRGMPWFVLEVLGILLLWSLLLNRTKPGRYIYAIGGNREAARRAGVNTQWIRTLGFTICSLNGGIAGLLIAGQFRGVSTSVDGGQLVLYSIAAAVIGGTSLFGGRGKVIHGVIGGLVIAGIVNGMALLELSAYLQYVITGLVLMVAVTIDAVTHRRAASTTSAATGAQRSLCLRPPSACPCPPGG